MLDGGSHAQLVVRFNAPNSGWGWLTVYEDDRRLAVCELFQPRDAQPRGTDHEPIHLPLPKQLERLRLALLILGSVVEEHTEAVMQPPGFDAAHNRRIERVRNAGDEQTHRGRDLGRCVASW